MYGSNNLGQAYYGQGPGVGTSFILHSVTATVSVSASISFKLLINKALSASVTATASVARTFMRTIGTSVTVAATSSGVIVFGLNIKRAATKFLNMYRATRGIAGFKNETELLTQKTTTKRITDA